jgi:archaellum component FlaF (FlaF/FlaG flagellin family)
MERKFKANQKVVVVQFMVNGSRMDINATFERYVYSAATKKELVEILFNGIYIRLDESRLEDYSEFWDRKNAKEKL